MLPSTEKTVRTYLRALSNARSAVAVCTQTESAGRRRTVHIKKLCSTLVAETSRKEDITAITVQTLKSRTSSRWSLSSSKI